MGPVGLNREAYDLALERGYLRTMRAAGRSLGGGEAQRAAIDRSRQETAENLDALAESFADRMNGLATRLGMEPADVEFAWACVAAAAEPRLLVHAQAL